MSFIFILEFVFFITFAWFFATQIFLPMLDGEEWFPLFRKRRELESKLAQVKTDNTDKEIKQEITELKRKRIRI